MEITSMALVSLACLLSSGKTDAHATKDFVENLTKEQVAVIRQVIDSDACLPDKFESKIQPGLGAPNSNSAPTSDF